MRAVRRTGWRVALVLLATAALGAAQTIPQSHPMQRPMPVPGSLNFVEGEVSLNGQPLTYQNARYSVVGAGQTLDTHSGNAEILLTPGTFLRVGYNSEIRMISPGIADTRVEVTRGEAMLEATDFVKQAHLTVVVRGANAQIDQKGLYQFNADRQSVTVLDGKAQVFMGDKHSTLRKGEEVQLASDKPLKVRDASLKAAESEQLYSWSRLRSQYEAQANLEEAYYVNAYGGWYGPGWYWDPYWGMYAFLPGWGMLYSPFGWGFYAPGFVGIYGGHFVGGVGIGGHPGGIYGPSAAFRGAGGFHSGFGGGRGR